MKKFYTVRQGETISMIAERWGLNPRTLIAANSLESPYRIFPGQQLSLPPGVNLIRVKAGESIYNISQKFGIPMDLIIQANAITPPYMIQVGQLLEIPEGIPYYVVQSGDSLYSIASHYQVVTADQSRPDLIMYVNRMDSPVIHPGMKLLIPYAVPGVGAWIAYTMDQGQGYDIWLYHLLHGVQVQLTEGLGTEYSIPYWSPDCSRIAFIGVNGIIYSIEIASGNKVEIDQIEPYTLISWSPDSHSISYTQKDQIVLYNVTTNSAKILSMTGAADVGWFPSGTELIFTAPDPNGISQLYRMDIKGRIKTQITQNADGPMHYVRLSPDGNFAVYTTPGASISMIKTVHVETGKVFNLEGGPLVKDYYPVWSPDSSTVAYSGTFYPESSYYNFILTNRNTGNELHSWAVSNCYNSPVCWTPDGNHLIYLAGCRNSEEASQIWMIDRRRPVPILLVQRGKVRTLSCSSRSSVKPPQAIYQNTQYHVSLPYPKYWMKMSEERYEEADGFFQIAAISGSDKIEEVSRSEAFHKLKPYGTSPRIVRSTLQGEEACYIYPSVDQPKEMNKQASLIVTYPTPIIINNSRYNYFILWADQPHIYAMGQGLKFLSV